MLTTILCQSEAAELYLLMARGSIPLNFDIGKLEAAIKGELQGCVVRQYTQTPNGHLVEPWLLCFIVTPAGSVQAPNEAPENRLSYRKPNFYCNMYFKVIWGKAFSLENT